MSEDAQRAYIEHRLQSQIEFYEPDWLVDFSNSPERVKALRVSYVIMGGKSKRANLGSRKVDRHVGVLQLNVVVPESIGNGKRDRMADWLGSIFNEVEKILKDDSRLHFRVPEFRDLGTKLGESVKVVSIPYWRDEPVK